MVAGADDHKRGARGVARSRRPAASGSRVHRKTTQAHHSAQPTCSDGIAASSLVRPPRPLGALASLPHQPLPDVVASTSTYPGSIRGGAIGSSTKPSQAGRGRQDQRVADPPVAQRVPPVDPDQHGRGDEVVQGGVPVAGDQREAGHAGQQVVGRSLHIEVQHRLEVQQVVGIGDGPGHVAVGQQPGCAVPDVQQGEQCQLDAGPWSKASPLIVTGTRVVRAGAGYIGERPPADPESTPTGPLAGRTP